LLVEVRSPVVANANLRRQGFEPTIANRLVPTCVTSEVRDTGDFEPDDERSMVRDALGVGLGDAHPDLGREREVVHRRKPKSF